MYIEKRCLSNIFNTSILAEAAESTDFGTGFTFWYRPTAEAAEATDLSKTDGHLLNKFLQFVELLFKFPD